jgi:hypothetical protein
LLLTSFLLSLNSASAEIQENQKENTPQAPVDTPIISIFSPANSSIFVSSNLSLAFNVTLLPDPRYSSSIDFFTLLDVWYKMDWQIGNFSVFHVSQVWDINSGATNFFFNKTLSKIPEGRHTIEVFANALGAHNEVEGGVIEVTRYNFNTTASSSVNFTTDTIFPTVSFLPEQNATYQTSKVTLNFTLNKPVSQIIYSLDGKANVTSNENTSITLTHLSSREHNVTIYAKDEYGQIGVSNTIYFSVFKPNTSAIPTDLLLIVTTILLIVGIMAVALVIYRKKHSKAEANK